MSIFYERLRKANEEIDRLRAEKAELLALIKRARPLILDSWHSAHRHGSQDSRGLLDAIDSAINKAANETEGK